MMLRYQPTPDNLNQFSAINFQQSISSNHFPAINLLPSISSNQFLAINAEVREVNGDDMRAEVWQADGVASRTRSRRPMGEGGMAGGKS